MFHRTHHKPLLNFIISIALFSFLCGCAGKRAKPNLSRMSEEERKAYALQVFREGAELLYVNDTEALERFDAAREIDPSLIAAYYNAGVALENLNNLAEAKKRYESCLATKKDEGPCLSNLLLVQAKLSEKDAAEKLSEQYLSEYPEAPFAKAAKAQLALYNGDLVSAEKFARAAIERNAQNVSALYVMARVFFAQKKYPAAKWVIKNALEYAPAHAGLYLLLGQTESELKNLHDALDAYEKAARYQPTEEALTSYGLLMLKRGKNSEALSVLQKLVERMPDNYKNYLHLANAYVANKKFEEAKAFYLKAKELKPDDKDIDFNLALLYYELKPENLSEMERLKTAENYFRSYLDQKDIAKERAHEVNNYLKDIKDKIALEQYRLEAEKEAAEAPNEAPVTLETGAGSETEIKDEIIPTGETKKDFAAKEPEAREPVKEEVNQEKKNAILPKKPKEEEVDEEEDLFDDF